MSRKIKVLLVDDAIVVRKVLAEVLAGDPDIEVAGACPNGKIALQRIPQLDPDLVVLDIEMPEMDGISTLVEIRKISKTLPVIMFSTLTERGASATIEALLKGANDYVTKPTAEGGVNTALNRVRDELVPKIKQLCGKITGRTSATAHRAAPAAPAAANAAGNLAANLASILTERVDVLAIGSSTGGPQALAAVLAELPANLPVPGVITQHMPPVFTKLLAERLTTGSKVKVVEAKDGDTLQPGVFHLAPGDWHMTTVRSGEKVIVKLNQQPPENSCRPSVDVMLRSVVDVYGRKTLACILTGMGSDGHLGCQKVKDAGGQVLAQDEATSVVWGMPGFVVRGGLADRVLPLDQIGAELTRRARAGRVGGG